MRTFFSTFTLAIAVIAQVFAQSSATRYAPTAEENSLLWEISGKELKQPSYLFGTIHLIGEEDFILSDVTKASFAKTKRVTFEIDMEDMTDISVLMPVMMKAFMSDGSSLRTLLNDEDYELVKNHFEKMGLPMMMMERIKPMFLSALAEGDMNALEGESGGSVSYEMELMKMAQDQEKEIEGLETMEYQMSIFDSIPYETQAEMLVESIKSADAQNDELNEMVELYKTQDLDGLQKMMENSAEVAEFNDILLVQRNKNWIPVMAKQMAEQPTFFAVGAGHLGGETGVIALLRAEGYMVKPLK